MEVNATIFVQIFIFMTLLLWLSRCLFTPILRLFDEREHRIGGAKRDAAELGVLAEEKARQFDVEYERARASARHLLTELKQQADSEQRDRLDRVRKLARAKLDAAEADIKSQALSIRPQLESASTGIAEEIIKALMVHRA